MPGLLKKMKAACTLPVNFDRFGLEVKVEDITQTPTMEPREYRRFPRFQLWGDALKIEWRNYLAFITPAGVPILFSVVTIVALFAWIF